MMILFDAQLPVWLWGLVAVAYLAGVVFIVTGFLVWVRNSKSWVNRIFFAYASVKGLWVFAAATILWIPNEATAASLYNLWWMGLLLFTFYFLAFGLSIMPFIRANLRLPILVVATVLGLSVGFVWVNILEYEVRLTELGWTWLPNIPMFLVGVFAFVVSYAVGLWGLVVAELQVQDERHQQARKAMFWALFAHMVAAGFFVLLGRFTESYWLVMFAPIANMIFLPIAAAKFWALRSSESTVSPAQPA